MSYTIDHEPYCFDCYQVIKENAETTPSLQHLLLDGPTIRGQPCNRCRQTIFRTRSAVNCDRCFQSYMYIATKVRETGNHPHDIKGFLYDNFKELLIRLFVARDDNV